MDKKYNCNDCEYGTDSKYNYATHLKSNKHLNNASKNKFKCKRCGKLFSHQSSLSRHENHRCDKQNNDSNGSPEIDNLKKTIEDMKNQMEQMKLHYMNKEINEKDQIIKELKDELKEEKTYYKKTLTQAGKIMTNMSNIDWIKAKYANAQPFFKLTNDDILKAFRSIEDNNIKCYKKKGSTEKDCFRKQMVYYNNNKKLYQFFCNLITKTYKKENNPEEQSLWACDVNRKNYAVMEGNDDIDSDDEFDDDKENMNWITDKHGIKIEEGAVKPVLVYARNILEDYICDPKIDFDKKEDEIKVLAEIKGNKLKNKIEIKLAGHFQLKRTD